MRYRCTVPVYPYILHFNAYDLVHFYEKSALNPKHSGKCTLSEEAGRIQTFLVGSGSFGPDPRLLKLTYFLNPFLC
jgi:hypothetical protein